MTFTAAVAGASGYAGGEVLRLLAGHPEIEVRTVTAHSQAGQTLGSVHPNLRELAHLELMPTTPEVLEGHDIVFLALPHGASGELTAQLSEATLVVDCGADHRLTDEAAWQAFYGGEWHGAWPYGMPELITGAAGASRAATLAKQRDELAGVTRIAVPGCNVTAVTLALQPAIAAGLVSPSDLTATLAVAPSGAGRKLAPHLLASELLGSAQAYAIGGTHRHIPEIAQNLERAGSARAGSPVCAGEDANSQPGFSLTFTPVLVPMARGIIATCTARLTDSRITQADIDAAYAGAYRDEAFIDVLPAGESPRVSDVLGSNACRLSATLDRASGRLIVVCVIDNLGKGTAGAAVQSTNLALGLAEHLGLTTNGVAP